MRRLIVGLVLMACSGCGGDGQGPRDDGEGAGPPDAAELGADVAPDEGLVLDGCDPRRLQPGQVRAKRVDCEEERVGGPAAISRIGDFILENHRVRFAIRAGGEGHKILGLKGGTVVDADRAREPGAPGGDLLQEVVPMTSFSALDVTDITITSPSGAEAVVRVTGTPIPVPVIASYAPGIPLPEASVTYEYALTPDADHLAIRTRVAAPAGKPGLDVIPIDGYFCSGATPPFDPGKGWRTGDPLPLLVNAGSGDVSYGYLGGPGFHMQPLGDVSLAMGNSVRVEAGSEVVIERWLFVGDGSISSVTDWGAARAGVATAEVSGCVKAGGSAAGPGFLVRAFDSRARPLTVARTDEAGCFAARLPVGEVTLAAGCDACTFGPALLVDVPEAGKTGVDLTSGLPSHLKVTARDDSGAAVPARVTLERLDRPGDGASHAFAWPQGALIPAPPGSYRVTFSRGFEHGRVVREVMVDEGDVEVLDVVVPREVETPGAVAAEFHIHSESSVDSNVPLADRVLACAAEGLEFVVATDHDFVTDYRPAIHAAGLDAFLASIPGQELSSGSAGHQNAWPIDPDPDRSGNGALSYFGLPPAGIARLAREGHPERVVQVNHPRFQDKSAFDVIGFDPSDGHAHADPVAAGFAPGTDFDDLPFDAYEVFNGIGDEERDEEVRDWYALLDRGLRVTATAGGDSHDLDAFPGHPRNLVLLDGGDDPASITAERIDAAVKAMRVVVTSGPYIEAGVVDPSTGVASRPGDVVSDTDGEATLRVRVQAPTWMELTEVAIVVGGEVFDSVAIADPGDPAKRPVVRLDASYTLPVLADTWVVVVARGGRAEPHMARLAPWAITNPYFVDADGDGAITPARP